LALLLWCCTGAAHAATIYKCVGAHGRTTYQDTPCPAATRGTRLDVHGQPRIDPSAPVVRVVPTSKRPRAQSPRRRTPKRTRQRKAAMSWACRAADGEVFYRHTRCPGSIPGDGVVREDYTQRMARDYPRGHHDAWSRVRVHGVRISRAEACRRIHSPGAAGRDGHDRDATVSTYDHLMGRDPCGTD